MHGISCSILHMQSKIDQVQDDQQENALTDVAREYGLEQP